jgi:hypothetical protein
MESADLGGISRTCSHDIFTNFNGISSPYSNDRFLEPDGISSSRCNHPYFQTLMVSAAHVVVTYFQILIELVAHEFMIYVQSSMISIVNVIMRDFQTLMSINYYKIKVLAAKLVYLVIQYFAIKFHFSICSYFRQYCLAFCMINSENVEHVVANS